MQGMGQRLRARARTLGISDSEVARRVELSQARYSAYVNEVSEPDLSTLVRICRVLGITPDEVLGVTEPATPTERDVLIARLAGAGSAMGLAQLRIAVALMDALLTTASAEH